MSGSYIPPDKAVKGPFQPNEEQPRHPKTGRWVAEDVETPPGPRVPKSSPTPVPEPKYGAPVRPRMQQGSI